MAMTEDTDLPRLTPRGDRLQGGGKLFRRPEELADEQFDLLAAAWSDDALGGDSLAETEEALASSPEKRMRAKSFRQIRLSPLNDRWEGRNRMLKVDPGTYAIRRTLIVTLTVAAALGALVILGPLKTTPDNKSTGPAVVDAYPMSEALIPEASPVINTRPAEGVTSATQNMNQTDGAANPSVDKTSRTLHAGVISGSAADITSKPRPVGVIPESLKPEGIVPQQNDITASATNSSIHANSEPRTTAEIAEYHDLAESIALMHDLSGAVPLLAAAPEASRLAPVELKDITPLPALEREENWLVRGLSLLAEAITKEPKSVDGYFIADACIRGVNRVLGWEMELEQEKNNEGEQLATNFSSSLLTFSAPAKKTHP
ncbi:MAG: hypothetical protein P1P83_08800 [Bacteroidales bacterium]|nr:hypothetical protein [Bacteroidales bacterium]MDT8373662.1 hypothetical protein [Bacteroidales bacterium]